uniref:Uncharacterized protein n=1 Tax=Rhizophora mucronata TaxID=61149 RepID=A0A2P2QGX0_RHIMU
MTNYRIKQKPHLNITRICI